MRCLPRSVDKRPITTLYSLSHASTGVYTLFKCAKSRLFSHACLDRQLLLGTSINIFVIVLKSVPFDTRALDNPSSALHYLTFHRPTNISTFAFSARASASTSLQMRAAVRSERNLQVQQPKRFVQCLQSRRIEDKHNSRIIRKFSHGNTRGNGTMFNDEFG